MTDEVTDKVTVKSTEPLLLMATFSKQRPFTLVNFTAQPGYNQAIIRL